MSLREEISKHFVKDMLYDWQICYDVNITEIEKRIDEIKPPISFSFSR